ncbi:MAG: hypothetical protein ACLQU1_34395 [Bryobacteraceae bacterium]
MTAAFFLATFRAALFDGGVSDAAFAAWNAAQRLLVASEIALLPAALIFRRLRLGGSGVAAGLAGPPDSRDLSSPILVSMCRLCSSNPRMAAVTISLVSFVGIDSPVHKTVYRLFDKEYGRAVLTRAQFVLATILVSLFNAAEIDARPPHDPAPVWQPLGTTTGSTGDKWLDFGLG